MKKKLTKILLIISLFASVISVKAQITPVEAYGELSVSGTKLVNEDGNQIQLQGMSLFWSQWEGAEFYDARIVEQLKTDWCTNIVRASMGIDADGGYLTGSNARAREEAKVRAVVEACIEKGMYVIIDWHSHMAEENTEEAVDFFTRMAMDYGNQPNVIFEVYNEPINQSWIRDIKPYCETVIAAIRPHSDNIVICGTPRWSQNVDDAASNPIDGNNIMYTLHYYAGTHGQDLRDRATEAIDAGLALFVTEFGTVNANGGGAVNVSASNEWFEFLDLHKLSYCNWSIVNKEEGSAVITPTTTVEDNLASNLTVAGNYMFDRFVRNCPVYGEPSTISINFTSPTETTFSDIEKVNFEVSASAPVDSIIKVDFYDRGKLLGTDFTEPYTFSTNTLEGGEHTIRAIARTNTDKTAQAFLSISIVGSNAVKKIGNGLVIDGVSDSEWDATEAIAIGNLITGTIFAPIDLTADYKILWDEENLYLLVNVIDNIKKDNATQIFNDDGIELFIDINNDKLTSYGASDYSYAIRYNEDNVTATENVSPAARNIEVGRTESVTGYVMEFAIPWDVMNENNPQAGDVLGFDIQVNDDDANSAARDASFAWNSTSDNVRRNPSLMGTLTLSDLITGQCIKPLLSEIANVGVEFCSGDDLTITANLDNGKVYQWFKDGDEINESEINENTLVVTEVGTYSVRIADEDVNDPACYTDSESLLLDCATGINDNKDSETSIYPNPFNDVLNVQDYLSYSLFNLSGDLVQEGEITDGTISTLGLSKSVYILKLIGDHKTDIVKVTKE